jgi:hypothetical protein
MIKQHPASRSLQLLLGILIALFHVGVAEARADAIDRFVRSEMERQQIPGLALAIVKHGKIVKAKGYGLANIENAVPVIPETVFQSGSVGKQFTAAGVLLLAEEGKLGLDDPISRYLTNAPPAWQGITIRHLLNHTSGIPDYEDQKDFNFRQDFTEAELVTLAAGLKPEFAPGSDWNYSNTGYAWHHHPSGYRDVLRRLSPGTHLQTAGDDFHPNHQRNQHRPAPRCGLRVGRGRGEESGLGVTQSEHDGRRHALFHRAGCRQVGCRALHGHSALRANPGTDMDAGEVWQSCDDLTETGRG